MTQQVHNTVFISYRRSVSAYLARAIYMDLKANGYDVFMDVESIDAGEFDNIILRQIEARAHFLIICTPGTFERVNEPGDWLRREIEHAMKHRRNIVPITASEFKFDDMTKKLLTGNLRELPRFNAVNTPPDYFEAAMERLRTRFLKSPVSVSLATTPASDQGIVSAQQARVESQPKPTVKQLSAEEYNQRGISRGGTDNLGAIADYTEAIRLNPRYAEAYANRGLAYIAKGNNDRAIADCTEAIRLNPRYANAYCNRALARSGKGDKDGAIADYTEAIRLNPQDAMAYFGRGLIRKDKRENLLALTDLQRYIELMQAAPNPMLTEAQGYIRDLKKKLGLS